MREQSEKKHWGLKILALLIIGGLAAVAFMPFNPTASTVKTTIPTNVTE